MPVFCPVRLNLEVISNRAHSVTELGLAQVSFDPPKLAVLACTSIDAKVAVWSNRESAGCNGLLRMLKQNNWPFPIQIIFSKFSCLTTIPITRINTYTASATLGLLRAFPQSSVVEAASAVFFRALSYRSMFFMSSKRHVGVQGYDGSLNYDVWQLVKLHAALNQGN